MAVIVIGAGVCYNFVILGNAFIGVSPIRKF